MSNPVKIEYVITGAGSTPLQIIPIYDPDYTQNQISIGGIITNLPVSLSGNDILATARILAAQTTTATPTTGSTMSINGNSVGNYDYYITGSSGQTITVSSFLDTDWFTTTQDTASAWVICKGNLTINSGQTFTPSVRKLFTVLYVAGNLSLSGTISMNGRGANHSGTGTSGGYTAPVDIRVGTGTFTASPSNLTNPTIPATDGAGGARYYSDGTTASNNKSNNGSSASTGGTGGGATGNLYINPSGSYVGAGSQGTCFSGGSGSGSCFKNNYTGAAVNSDDAGANGGAGTNGFGNLPVGGSGNPPGTSGGTGTGGVVIVICEGTITGAGAVQANGVNTGNNAGNKGGGSGGGCVYILYKTDSSTVSTSVTGGNTTTCAGGAGTARKMAIGAN